MYSAHDKLHWLKNYDVNSKKPVASRTAPWQQVSIIFLSHWQKPMRVYSFTCHLLSQNESHWPETPIVDIKSMEWKVLAVLFRSFYFCMPPVFLYGLQKVLNCFSASKAGTNCTSYILEVVGVCRYPFWFRWFLPLSSYFGEIEPLILFAEHRFLFIVQRVLGLNLWMKKKKYVF